LNMVDALTIAHLAGALWMAAGAGTLTLITFAGGRATDRFALRFSAKLQRLSVLAAIVPGSLVAVAFGSWLASELEYSFGGAWISISYLLWVAFLGIATGVVSPRARLLEQLAAQADAAGGPPTGHVDRVTTIAVVALDVLLLLFIYLMATRPGA